ncbi:hypothetical protein IEQ34_007079 [Dendrobium chrysotoxum]|uniref:Uncharacterized protein n=1 Tax=Dendrobium chrysotoxum TaxID=161865 RepID=A0AAV7H8J4_DENCH|nr:hypothetical protein IEQ34_007079 [Dendrobium chrysotoxum]
MEKPSSFSKGSTQFLLSAPVDAVTSTQKCCNNNEAKCELVDYDSVPEFLKHNEFIVNCCRSEWPLQADHA